LAMCPQLMRSVMPRTDQGPSVRAFTCTGALCRLYYERDCLHKVRELGSRLFFRTTAFHSPTVVPARPAEEIWVELLYLFKEQATGLCSKAVSYVSDHKRAVRATRAKRANRLPVLRRRTQEASRERSTSVSVMSWKGKRGLLLS
jgi:hypothetical protein